VLKKKNKKRKDITEHRTAANPPQKPTHKAQRGGYAAVQPFSATKKKAPFFVQTKRKKLKNLEIQFYKLSVDKLKNINLIGKNSITKSNFAIELQRYKSMQQNFRIMSSY
jgi:hypothetical protein